MTPPRPLTAEDDRGGFDCGRESLNQWFRRHAWRNQAASTSRTNLVCDRESGAIIGYVTLSTAQIERAWLPKASQRNPPDPVPAVLLGQLAVDLRHQGQGHAASLMIFALRTTIRFSEQIGCFGVLTQPLDDKIRDFYRRFGFEDLPFDPGRAMIARMADLKRSGFA